MATRLGNINLFVRDIERAARMTPGFSGAARNSARISAKGRSS